jgi:hypothetical protein
MNTLGFDASLRTVGFAFYNGTEIIDAGFIDISKLTTNKDKAFSVIKVIESNPNLKDTSNINLEAALNGFMNGFTSQQVIIKLARWNAVFQYIIEEQWGKPVKLIGATTARKSVFGKARIKGVKSKVFVRQQIDEKFAYVHQFDKKNKRDGWDVHNEDMYDAIVIAISK